MIIYQCSWTEDDVNVIAASISECPCCGGLHTYVKFRKLQEPINGKNYAAECNISGKIITVNEVDMVSRNAYNQGDCDYEGLSGYYR